MQEETGSTRTRTRAAWSQSEQSGLFRPFACSRCFRRKQRCDRLLPACSSCQKLGLACESTEKEDAVVVSRNDEILKKGYVRVLEEKLDGLERLASQRGLSLPPDGAEDEEDARAFSTPSLLEIEGDMPAPTASAAGNNDDDDDGDSPPADMSMRLMSLSAMAEPQSRRGELLRELSLPMIISSITETYGGDPETSRRVDMVWDSVAKHVRRARNGTERPLYVPSRDANSALRTYLDIVDARFPRVALTKIQHGIEVISAEDDGLFKDTLTREPAQIFMAYMVIGIVPLVANTYPIAQGSFISTHVLAESLKVLEEVFRKEDGVDIIHCLHLLVVFSIHSCTAGSSWHLIGMAMRKCIALGYHREITVPANTDVATAEARRWAFWSCYLLDRLISAALCRPPTLNDKYITVELPGSAIPLSVTERAQVDLFKYALVLSSMTSDRGRQPFAHHLGRLLDWKLNATFKLPAPPSPTEDASLVSQVFAEHQASLHSTLLLRIIIDQINAAGQREITRSAPPARMEQIRNLRAVGSCRNVLEHLNRASMKTRPFLSWITGYSALSAAIAILYVLGVCKALEIPDHGVPELWSKEEHCSHYSTGQTPAADGYVSNGNIGPDALLLEACQILSNVGRQFPRMSDYCRLVLDIRKAIRNRDLGHIPSSDIKPGHLRKIVEALRYLVTQDSGSS